MTALLARRRRAAGLPAVRHRMRLACLLAVALSLAACSPKLPPVKIEQTRYVSFAAYRTYAWLPPVSGVDSELFGTRLTHEVETQMAGRGYIITADGPDLFVELEVTVDDKNIDTLREFGGYEDAGGTQNFFAAYSFGYEVAVVTVNVYDGATRQRVWRGRTPVSMDAKHRVERAAAGVAEMFKSFPASGGGQLP